MASIVMSSADVIAACDIAIASVIACRETRNKELIQYIIDRHAANKFLWIFDRKPLTEKEATDWLMQSWEYYFPSMAGNEKLRHAKKLKKLAEKGDPVTLNETDVDLIF